MRKKFNTFSSEVTSLDRSMELFESGVPQDSFFYWVEDDPVRYPNEFNLFFGIENTMGKVNYSAFTLSEMIKILGGQLPAEEVAAHYIANVCGDRKSIFDEHALLLDLANKVFKYSECDIDHEKCLRCKAKDVLKQIKRDF